MHSRIGDEEGSRWASLIICAEFYTTDEVGGGPGFGAVNPDMLRDVCLPRYAELLSSSIRSMISSHFRVMTIPIFLLHLILVANLNHLNWAWKRQVEEYPVDEVQPSRAECMHDGPGFVCGRQVQPVRSQKIIMWWKCFWISYFMLTLWWFRLEIGRHYQLSPASIPASLRAASSLLCCRACWRTNIRTKEFYSRRRCEYKTCGKNLRWN